MRKNTGLLFTTRCVFGILLLFFCLAGSSLFVRASEKKVIRVAYPRQQAFTETDAQGGRHGYTYEYLMEIAKYAPWEYEFVGLEGDLDEQLTTALDMLEKGELDLMGAMIYNASLNEIYDYAGYNYGTSYWVLASLSSNTSINSDNFYLEQPLRVAVTVQGGTANRTLNSFAGISGFEVEQVYCETEEEQIEMLRNGEVHAILSKTVALPQENLKILASFSPQPFYFATTKGNEEIIKELDQALLSIKESDPYFSVALQEKYFVPANAKYELTEEEKKFVAESDVLNVVALGGKAPIQYIDPETGEYRGVSMDILDYISQHTGLRFHTYMTDDFAEYSRMLQEKEADLCLGAPNSMHQYDWQDMLYTTPYLESHLSIVLTAGTSPSDLQGKSLALPLETAYGGEYDGEVVYFETSEDCLEAVHKSLATYCYTNTYTIQYYTGNPKYNNLIVLPQNEEWSQNFCIGITHSDEDILLGILNKSINQLSEEGKIKNYLYDNAYQLKTVTLGDFFLSNPLEASLTLLLVCLLFLLIILIILTSKERTKQKLKKLENQRYEQICEISNEYLFEYSVKEGLLKLSDKCAEFLQLPARIMNVRSANYVQLCFLPRLLECKTPNTDLSLSLADGSLRWVRISTKQVADSHGNVVYLVGKMQNIQKEVEEKAILQAKAEKDFLTGLYNISTFREKAKALYQSYPDGKFAFYILDIDYFKKVNDNFGHHTGDRLLAAVGGILKNLFVKDTEITARLGGDEFVALALCSEIPEEIHNRCRQLHSNAAEIHFEDVELHLTVSIGVAVTNAFVEFDDAYKLADKALYQAKRDGRSCYRIAAEPLSVSGRQ